MTMTVKLLVIMMVCMVGGIFLDVLPDSPATPVMKWCFRMGQAGVWVWWFRLGYLRRRPHWTPASWTRFAVCTLACVAAAALAIAIGAAVDSKWNWVGAAGSTLRSVWAFVGLLGILVGGGGLGLLLVSLSAGEAERQFSWPHRQRQSG